MPFAKTIRRGGSLLLLLFASATAADFGVPSGTYVLEATHGYITFSYSHLGFSNPQLGFNRFDVTLKADAAAPAKSTVAVSIDAASIDSRVDEFDEHLVGADFFDVEQYPEITFVSKAIRATGETTFDVVGDLTIKSVTRPVTLAATVNKADQHPMRKVPTIGLSAATTLKRSEFDLGRFVPAVGDEVTVSIEVELIKE